MTWRTLQLVCPQGSTFDLVHTGTSTVAMPTATAAQASRHIAGRMQQIHGLPPMSRVADRAVLAAGETLRLVRHEPREIVVPVTLLGFTEIELDRWIDQLAYALDPKLGDSLLNVTRGDGTIRQLRCRYTSGMNAAIPGAWTDSVVYPLVMRAADPYWYAPAGSSQAAAGWAAGAATAWNDPAVAWNQFVAWNGASNQQQATLNITNTGTVDTAPTITAVGTFIALKVANLSTGQFWEYRVPDGIAATHTVTANHASRTITATPAGGSAANAWGRLSPASSLFALRPGLNALQLIATTTAPTSLNVTWTPRWLTC